MGPTAERSLSGDGEVVGQPVAPVHGDHPGLVAHTRVSERTEDEAGGDARGRRRRHPGGDGGGDVVDGHGGGVLADAAVLVPDPCAHRAVTVVGRGTRRRRRRPKAPNPAPSPQSKANSNPAAVSAVDGSDGAVSDNPIGLPSSTDTGELNVADGATFRTSTVAVYVARIEILVLDAATHRATAVVGRGTRRRCRGR